MHSDVRRPFVFIAGAVLLALVLPVVSPAIGQGTPGFTDITASAGVTFAYVLTADNGYASNGGGTEGDFNDDGWPDLFLAGGGGAADGLFMNNGDGTFTNTAAAAGLTQLYRGNGANAADYDNDGDLDIYVTSFGDVPGLLSNGKHKLWNNAGNASFTNVAVAAGVNSTGSTVDGFGSCWGDYDLDGDLDLYVAGRFPPGAGQQDHNRLFHNDLVETGVAAFHDVSVQYGIFPTGTSTQAFSGIFADMDGDHYPELLIAADFGTTRYLRNDGGTGFTAVPDFWAPGDEKVFNGMGACVGDFNRDGLLDWYVTSMYPAASFGGADGNRLYLNQGDHVYQSLPESAGVNDGGWAWGTATIDFDQDGWLDIIVANGQWYCDTVTLECFDTDPTFLFRNNGDDTFSEVHAAMNLINEYQTRGVIVLDYDRDGDMDVGLTSNPKKGPNDPPETGNFKLYRNEICNEAGPASGANWLQVKLDTSGSHLAPHGLGADVRIQTGSVVQRIKMYGGDNYLSRSQMIAHAGLGAATVVDELTVTWPDGSTTQMLNVPADQLLTIAWADPTWTDLGYAKAGSNGLPSLTATGDLSPNSLNQLDLANAAPSSAATLVFGLTQLSVPFKGGVLVPAPLLLVSLATDAAGSLTLPFLLPSGLPAGLSLYFQYWISDAGATKGLSASNGLRGVTS